MAEPAGIDPVSSFVLLFAALAAACNLVAHQPSQSPVSDRHFFLRLSKILN
jgi:hypothetical protein